MSPVLAGLDVEEMRQHSLRATLFHIVLLKACQKIFPFAYNHVINDRTMKDRSFR